MVVRINSINLIFVVLLILTGCTASSTISTNIVSSPTPTSTVTTTTSGIKAAKILFKLKTQGGSFAAPPPQGTVPSPGSGVQATQIFNADGTVLSSNGPGSTNWPGWLTSFEIGVSGTSNTSSVNSHCANFADVTESSLTNCNVGPTPIPAPAKCGAPSGQYRVSEVDCSLGSPAALPGTGGGSDGVYFRAVFNRDTSVMGSAENMMVVLEYAVSALNPAPSNPTTCFLSVSGQFSPEQCSDFVWRAYLKKNAGDLAQSFLLLVPPTYSAVLGSGQAAPTSSGTGTVARQFILPLAMDPTLKVLQISRTGSKFPSSSALQSYCTNGTLPGDSPLCAGIIFYSITFYRI